MALTFGSKHCCVQVHCHKAARDPHLKTRTTVFCVSLHTSSILVLLSCFNSSSNMQQFDSLTAAMNCGQLCSIKRKVFLSIYPSRVYWEQCSISGNLLHSQMKLHTFTPWGWGRGTEAAFIAAAGSTINGFPPPRCGRSRPNHSSLTSWPHDDILYASCDDGETMMTGIMMLIQIISHIVHNKLHVK